MILIIILALSTEIQDIINKVSQDSLVPSWILERIVEVESGGIITAIHLNRDGSKDYGLMQINSRWVNKLGLDTMRLIYDPEYNVRVGAGILRRLIKQHGFTLEAIGRYHSPTPSRAFRYIRKILLIK